MTAPVGFTLKQNQLNPLNTAILRTWFHSRTASYSPTAATVEKFTVTGGKVLVHLMLGTVDTTLETTSSNVSVVTNPTTGTSDDIATTADASAVAAGNMILIEGDGTAAIVAAGVSIFPLGAPTPWIARVGGIEVIHSAAMTGTLHWDLWWEPLDENASVVGV